MWLPTPLPDQVASKEEATRQALAELADASSIEWLPPALSPERDFRTKAKLVVGGTPRRPTLGTLDHERRGVDLPGCPIQHPAINAATPALKRLIRSLRIQPYDVARRSGELKYIHAYVGTNDTLMLRFVLRSRQHVPDLRAALPQIRSLMPQARVVTANIHPRHEATVEGPDEIILTSQRTLPIRVGGVDMMLGPRSFVQTNTEVAGQLYRQVRQWCMEDLSGGGDAHEGEAGGRPRTLWDLYCGTGAFALHCAHAGMPHVTGVEVSSEAIASARAAAKATGLGRERTDFLAADATEWALAQDHERYPDVLVVNPPRRGIGEALARWVNDSGIVRVVYSSCNPKSLAVDLQRMPTYRVVQARLFDMFPHTAHAEVAVLLERKAPQVPHS